MLWLYDLPEWLLCALVIAVYAVVSVAGVWLVRPWAQRAARDLPDYNELVSYFLSAGGVLYGLLLGLVAVGAWENHADAEDVVTHEAGKIAALHRDLSAYPQPMRGELQALLKEYVRFVIEDAWPAQRRGVLPTGGTARANAIYERMNEFNPATPAEIVLDQEAMSEFNSFLEARQQRLDAVSGGLPAAIWWVVIGGSIAMLGTTFLFRIPKPRLQIVLTLSLGLTTGLLVFLIIVMDHPFRGRYGIDPTPYELVRSELLMD
ncbi:MAG: hypothetical protein V4689_10830 [Verrucomicrobiota bacterium]